MKSIIKYTDKNEVASKIEFDNLEDAYSFTFDFNCQSIEVIGHGVYTVEEFQKAFSNDEF